MTATLGAPLAGARRVDPSRTRRAAREHVRTRWVDVALTGVVAVGAGFRLWALGGSKLGYDESFTAMAGRLPFGRLIAFLTLHDSHPPLDYLIHAPLARVGASELWFRLPSALCSVAALVLLARWLRPRGWVAVTATALFALSAFELTHGRDARMYAELELIGVAVAVVTDRWLRAPTRGRAVGVGVLVLAGLYTHVSMFLLAIGLFALVGLRRDRDAWEWRAAVVAPVAIWAVTWGPHFLIQARGGHSSWIPATTAATLVTAIARSVTFRADLAVAVVAVIAAGAVVLWRRDRTLARVWIACFAVPVAVAAVAGRFAPVVLDRTFTLMAWAPVVAIAFALDALTRRRRLVGVTAFALATVLVLVPDAAAVVRSSTGPTAPLDALERRMQPGDVVAVRPASKAPELEWSLAVRHGATVRPVTVPSLPHTFALRIGSAPRTGRIWYLDWAADRNPQWRAASPGCAATWKWGGTHIDCLTGQAIGASGP